MKHTDVFSGCHPAVLFLYFTLVLLFSMILMHPVCLAISLCTAALYALYLRGASVLRFGAACLLPTALLAAFLNAAFNHAGMTILAYLPSGNPLTLESLAYGLAAALMLCAVLLWFFCCNAVMTTDHFVYLFGRILPALSLVLSMTLRFIPRFTQQLRVIREAQCGLGEKAAEKTLLQRMKNGVTALSILLTWSLENAIETADSMKSRGYGLPGRTSFSIYRLDRRDGALLLWLALCGLLLTAGVWTGGIRWRYFPAVRGALWGPLPTGIQLLYLALCLTPVSLDAAAGHAWKKARMENEALQK